MIIVGTSHATVANTMYFDNRSRLDVFGHGEGNAQWLNNLRPFHIHEQKSPHQRLG